MRAYNLVHNYVFLHGSKYLKHFLCMSQNKLISSANLFNLAFFFFFSLSFLLSYFCLLLRSKTSVEQKVKVQYWIKTKNKNNKNVWNLSTSKPFLFRVQNKLASARKRKKCLWEMLFINIFELRSEVYPKWIWSIKNLFYSI